MGQAAELGLRRPRDAPDRLRALLADDHPSVRAAALTALVRLGRGPVGRSWRGALVDPAEVVRSRAAELAPAVRPADVRPLVALLDDPVDAVAEAAAFALGELGEHAVAAGAVMALARAGAHADPLVREAAVAALGSLGDPEGLPAVLAGCRDRPAVRRRAVLALAAFDGPEVDAALERARSDPDWQVRQAAEDLG